MAIEGEHKKFISHFRLQSLIDDFWRGASPWATFPVPSLYLPCTFPVPSLYRRGASPWATFALPRHTPSSAILVSAYLPSWICKRVGVEMEEVTHNT